MILMSAYLVILRIISKESNTYVKLLFKYFIPTFAATLPQYSSTEEI